MMDIQRSTLWAMSGRDSRSPRGDWVWSTKRALPPSVLMPASKVRRVRRLAFSKNITIWRASRAWRKSSGWFLTAWASSMTAAISWTVRSEMEQRSRPVRRLEASLKAVSDWMPNGGLPCSSAVSEVLAFIMTVLLPMRLVSCRCCSGECCCESVIERLNGCVDVSALEDERRQEAKHGFAGAIDDDALRHEVRGDLFGEIGRVDLYPQHEAYAANVDDAVVAGCELRQLLVEIGAGCLDVIEEVGLFDGVDDGDRDCAG